MTTPVKTQNGLERLSWTEPKRWKHEWINDESPHLAGSLDNHAQDATSDSWTFELDAHAAPFDFSSVADEGWEVKADAPTKPPNYRPAAKRLNAPHCGSCKMYEHGKCWGYGNIKVEKDAVCDSYTPSSHKTEAMLRPADNSQQSQVDGAQQGNFELDRPLSSFAGDLDWKLPVFDDEADMSSWHFAAEPDELFIALNVPKPTADEIHKWAKKQDWPEGTELEEPSEYHITLLYAPKGHKEHKEAEWWATDNSDSIHINSIEEFPSTERGELNAFVLRVDTNDDEIKTRMERLLDDAESHGVEVKRYDGGSKPHITVAYGPKLPDGLEPPDMSFSSDEAHCGKPRTSSVDDSPHQNNDNKRTNDSDAYRFESSISPQPDTHKHNQSDSRHGKDKASDSSLAAWRIAPFEFSGDIGHDLEDSTNASEGALSWPLFVTSNEDIVDGSAYESQQAKRLHAQANYGESGHSSSKIADFNVGVPAAPTNQEMGRGSQPQTSGGSSLSEVAHNLHYKFDQSGLDPTSARQYANKLLQAHGYSNPDEPTIEAAIQAWKALYPSDLQSIESLPGMAPHSSNQRSKNGSETPKQGNNNWESEPYHHIPFVTQNKSSDKDSQTYWDASPYKAESDGFDYVHLAKLADDGWGVKMAKWICPECSHSDNDECLCKRCGWDMHGHETIPNEAPASYTAIGKIRKGITNERSRSFDPELGMDTHTTIIGSGRDASLNIQGSIPAKEQLDFGLGHVNVENGFFDDTSKVSIYHGASIPHEADRSGPAQPGSWSLPSSRCPKCGESVAWEYDDGGLVSQCPRCHAMNWIGQDEPVQQTNVMRELTTPTDRELLPEDALGPRHWGSDSRVEWLSPDHNHVAADELQSKLISHSHRDELRIIGKSGRKVFSGEFDSWIVHPPILAHEAKRPKVRKTEKPQKCKECKEPATKSLIWAEGMAYVPVCDKHEQSVRKELGEDEVCAVHTIKQAAKEFNDEDFPWMRGGCGEYAQALKEINPALRYGMNSNDDIEDGERVYDPVHVFAHDDKYAYDATGRHPLPYNPFNSDHTEYDVHPENVTAANFNQEEGDEDAYDHIARRFPQWAGHAYLAQAGYNPSQAPQEVIDYVGNDDIPEDKDFQAKYPQYFRTSVKQAGETIPQQIRRWEELRDGDWNRPSGVSDEMWAQAPQSQSQSEVVHRFPDEWTIQRHPDTRSVRSVGQMMRNCWQEANPAANQRFEHHTLNDPNDIPRVAFSIQTDSEPRRLHGPLAARNRPITPRYAQYLASFAQAQGIDPNINALRDAMRNPEWEMEAGGAAQKMANQALYHVAPTTERQRILQHGLYPSDPTQNEAYDWGVSPQEAGETIPAGVYGFPDLEQAQAWRQLHDEYNGEGHDIWHMPVEQDEQDPDQPQSRLVRHLVTQPQLVYGPEYGPQDAKLLSNPSSQRSTQARARKSDTTERVNEVIPSDELSHFLARVSDSWDTRQWPDPIEGTRPTDPLPKGCTCQNGQDSHTKLTCPVHGLEANGEYDDQSWSVPENSPVGYPQDQPRNWQQAVSAIVNPKDKSKENKKANQSNQFSNTHDTTSQDRERYVHGNSLANSRPSCKEFPMVEGLRQSIEKSESDFVNRVPHVAGPISDGTTDDGLHIRWHGDPTYEADHSTIYDPASRTLHIGSPDYHHYRLIEEGAPRDAYMGAVNEGAYENYTGPAGEHAPVHAYFDRLHQQTYGEPLPWQDAWGMYMQPYKKSHKEADYDNWDTVPVTPEYSGDLYHVVPTEDRNRVIRHGLQVSDPGLETDRNRRGQQPVGIYGWEHPDLARKWGEWRSGETEENPWARGYDIWRIPSEQIRKRTMDPIWGAGSAVVPHTVYPVLHEGVEDRGWPTSRIAAVPVNVHEIGKPTYDGRQYHGDRRPFTYIQHMKNLFLGPPGGDHYQMMKGKQFANIEEEPRGGVYTDPEGKRVVEFYSGTPEPEHIEGIVNALGADRAQLNEWHPGDEVHDNPDYQWNFNSKVAMPVSDDFWQGYPGPLYHGTTADRLPSIMEHGLQPWDSPIAGGSNYEGEGWDWLRPRPNHVYLSQDPFQAHDKSANASPWGEKIITLEIDPRYLNSANIDPDEDDMHHYVPGAPTTMTKGLDRPDQLGDQSLGEYAENEGWGSNPEDTERAINDQRSIAHRGIIPPEAITPGTMEPDPNEPPPRTRQWRPLVWPQTTSRVAANHVLNWQPGQYGKGLVHEGVVHTWPTNDDSDGQPGHPQYAQENLGFNTGEHFWNHPTWESAFTIDPEGRTVLFENHPDIAETVQQADPRLKVNALSDWDFGPTEPTRTEPDSEDEKRLHNVEISNDWEAPTIDA